jgi:hypothetical protein
MARCAAAPIIASTPYKATTIHMKLTSGTSEKQDVVTEKQRTTGYNDKCTKQNSILCS